MDITKLSPVRQELALVGLKSQLQTQRVLAGIVGDVLQSAKQTAAASGSGGMGINIVA